MSEKSDHLLKQVEDILVKLHEVAGQLENTIEPVCLGFQGEGLMPNVKLYAQVEYLQDIAKALSKMANVVEPVIADRVAKHMTADDMENVTYNGRNYFPDTKTYVSVNAENKPSVIAWLKSHSAGRELVKEDVHTKTLESWVKAEQAEGRTVHPGISIFEKATLGSRKVKGK